VHDVQGALNRFLPGVEAPMFHQLRELASLGRVQVKIQPGRALGGSVLPALSVALDWRQLRARSGRPAWWTFFIGHDALFCGVNDITVQDKVTGYKNYFTVLHKTRSTQSLPLLYF
jgi:hypothetical protein